MTLQLVARLSHSSDLCGGVREGDEATARWCRNPRLRAAAQPVRSRETVRGWTTLLLVYQHTVFLV